MPPHIVIHGTGAMGCFFGAALVRAGHNVSFISRGRTLVALQERGISVVRSSDEFSVNDLRVTDDPATLPEADFVLLCVKAWQVREACEQLKPIVTPETVVLPLQNGVEAPEHIAQTLSHRNAVGGMCKIIVHAVEPGVIEHVGVHPEIHFGELRDGRSQRTRLLQHILESAGVHAVIPDSIRTAMWSKFLFITTASGIGAATRMPLGGFREAPEARHLIFASLQELAQLASDHGVELPADVVASIVEFIDSLPHEGTMSMQRDIMKGQPSELDAQTGAAVRLARESGTQVPVSEFLYACLAPMERAARGLEVAAPIG